MRHACPPLANQAHHLSAQGRSRTFNSCITGYRNSASITVTRFRCEDPECGAVVDEVSLAGQAARRGLRLTLAVPAGDAGDASRKRLLLKADTATIIIPELEFEISPSASVPFTGDLVTVEGCLRAAASTLGANQEQRRAEDAEQAGKIDVFLQVAGPKGGNMRAAGSLSTQICQT